jgi:hypothetical protein
MKITRVWAMPDKNTFQIKPIREMVGRVLQSKPGGIFCDPFINHSPYAPLCRHQNDLDPAIPCSTHMDALDFLRGIPDADCDVVLFDPPYSPRQVAEHYKRLGVTVNSETTRASYWSNLKAEIARITKRGGIVFCCGWNSGGIGMALGFDMLEVLIVPHGGAHNDTIVTMETKR